MPVQDIGIRLLIAMAIGGIIGGEREYYNRPAGFRTHILVCTGAAVISLIQVHMAQEAVAMIMRNPELANAVKVDFGRMGAQVISGVGFLGAGTILHHKGSVKGLTTAASLWNIACLGLAVGMGYYLVAVLGAAACMAVLFVLRAFQARLFKRTGTVKILIRYRRQGQETGFLSAFFTEKGVKIANIEYNSIDSTGANENIMTCEYTLTLPKHLDCNILLGQISVVPEIISVKFVQE